MPSLRLLALLPLLLLAACSRDTWPDRPLTAAPAIRDDLSRAIADHGGDTVVVLSFSGGGVRASALAYGVLRELGRTRGANGRSLLDDVAVVSSVSGGSVTAAWFALGGPQRLGELEPFLYADNMAELELRAINPLTWVKLAGPNHSRIDLLDGYLRDRLFGKATLGDVVRRRGPLLVLNATDMGSGQVFPFTQSMFAHLCADHDQFPLSTAVTASAAFPIALTPVTLKNHSGLPDCAAPPPPSAAIAAGLDPDNRWRGLDRYKRARWWDSLRRHLDRADPPFRPVDYVHLLDGGVIDNLGEASLAEELSQALPLLAAKGKKRLVWVVVNARADAPNDIDRDGDTPGILTQIGTVVGVPIDGKTAATAEVVESYFSDIDGAVRDYAACRARLGEGCAKFYPWGGPDVPVRYSVSVDFDQFGPQDAALRDRLKAAATSWTLPRATIDDAVTAGAKLVRQHPCFRRLTADMGNVRDDDAALRKLCPLAHDLPGN
jgi:NTE family protein